MAAALVLVLSLLALGLLAQKLRSFPEQASEVLNRFVIDVCLPAALLRLVPSLRFQGQLLALIATPWLLALACYLLARAARRLLGLDRATAAVLFLCTALGNTLFLGFPLCSALLGERALPLAAIYDQLGSFLLLSVVAPLAVARASGSDRPSPAQMLKRVLTFPPLIALVVALLPLPRPAVLDAVLAQIGAALVPTAIFAVGLRFRLAPPRPLRAFALGLAVKLGLSPLLAWGLARALSAPRDVLEVAVLQSAMPSMITGGALAIAAGLAPELAAALIGWGVVAALITVPIWAALLR